MNQYILFWSGGMKTKIYSWWDGKTQEEQIEVELMAAIIGPKAGLIIGMLIISFI
jgi:hypothetical protein